MIPDELLERVLEFAAKVGKMVDVLPKTTFGRHVAGELLRAATAAGPSYEDAFATQRRIEFTTNLDDALRLLRKARYWLRLILKAHLLPDLGVEALEAESAELCTIMGQSIATARSRAWREGRFGRWQATDLQFTVYGFPFATFAMGARRQPPATLDANGANGARGQ